MPRACRAHNAFHPTTVLAQLYLPVPATYPARRCFSATSAPAAAASPATAPADQPAATALNVRRYPSANPEQEELVRRHARNILPDSLTDTLEAHRTTNRGTLIRRLKIPPTSKHATWRARFEKESPETIANEIRPDVTAGELAGGNRRLLQRPPETKLPKSGSKTESGAEFRRLRQNNKKKQKPLEYEGRPVPHPLRPDATPTGQLPWMKYVDLSEPAHRRLEMEIKGFHEYMMPSAAESAAKETAIEAVQELARSLKDPCTLELFGSQRTGLALVTSDIDLRLTTQRLENTGPKPPGPGDRKSNVKALQNLLPHFQRSPDFKNACILYSRYPLISIQHKVSGIDVQIVSCNDTQHARDKMQWFIEILPGLKETYTLVKATFDMRGLSNVFRGGLGSYSIFMLVVASLRLTPRGTSGGQRTMAENLLAFLSFSDNVDTYHTVISLDPPRLYVKKPNVRKPGKRPSIKARGTNHPTADALFRLAVIDPVQPWRLCLQDPADATNDLGRNAHGIKHIIATLRELHQDLLRSMCYPAGHEVSLLNPMIGNSHKLHASRRAKLTIFGEYVLAQRGAGQIAAPVVVVDGSEPDNAPVAQGAHAGFSQGAEAADDGSAAVATPDARDHEDFVADGSELDEIEMDSTTEEDGTKDSDGSEMASEDSPGEEHVVHEIAHDESLLDNAAQEDRSMDDVQLGKTTQENSASKGPAKREAWKTYSQKEPSVG